MLRHRLQDAIRRRDPRGTPARQDLTSLTCQEGRHGRCLHGVGAVSAPDGTPRTRMCPCACHPSCPLTVAPPVTPERFQADCTCPGAERLRQALVDPSGLVERHNVAVKAAFEEAERAEVGSRAELRTRLDAALGGAGVSFPPTFRDTWVRTQWAARGPRWAYRPRVLGAQVHGTVAGLRSMIRFARQATPEQSPLPRNTERRTRLLGGVYGDSVRGPVLGAVAAVGLAVGARGRTPFVRRSLISAAALSALPAVALVAISAGLGFLMRALRGWGQEMERKGSWPDVLGPANPGSPASGAGNAPAS